MSDESKFAKSDRLNPLKTNFDDSSACQNRKMCKLVLIGADSFEQLS